MIKKTMVVLGKNKKVEIFKSKINQTNKKLIVLKFAVFVLIIIIVISLINIYDLTKYFNVDKVREYVESFGALGPLVYIGIYIVAMILFIPATPFTALAGVLFGTFLGTFYAVLSATIGASIAFFVSRFFGRGFVRGVVENKFKKLKEYDKKLEKNGLSTILFLRIVPIFPFNGLNFALGLTKLKFRDFFFGTFFGIIPGAFAISYFSDSFSTFSVSNIIMSLILVGLLFGIMPTYKYYLKRKARNQK